jgi:tetratricopeptide (TPR) repeat protein
MSIELIRGELERLYSLEEMMDLSSRLLGFEPREVGGTASTASFARALTDHCQQRDAVAALIDAVQGTKGDAAPQLGKLVHEVLRAPVDLKLGDAFGEFKIVRKIGAGPNGTVYAAKHGESNVALKILHAAAIHDKSSVHRLLTRNRLASTLESAHLPTGLRAGFVDGKPFVAYESNDARPLAQRVARSGPLHINEARPILHGIVAALKALHGKKLPHGAVKLENVLVGKNDDGSVRVQLVDVGGDLLWSAWVHSDTDAASAGRVKTLAPEQFKGNGTTTKSDLYGFGALMFELLTGKAPIEGGSAADLAIASASKAPARAIELAPKGWVSEALSELCAQLLEKTPASRPALDAVLEALGPLEQGKEAISDEELTNAIDALVADPNDAESAISLELTLDRLADPQKVAEAFLMAADMLDIEESTRLAGEGEESAAIREAKVEAARDRASEAKKGLLFRAARLFDSKLKNHQAAEDAFKAVLAIDPQDDVAQAGYEAALKAQDKLDELVEKLLEVSQNSTSHSERSRSLHKIGQLYAGPLDDKDQAVFAFAQALAQDIQNDEYADDLERTAGSDMSLWAEAMRELHEVSAHPRMPQETRIALFMRLGRWYIEKINRPDLGLPCFDTVLTLEPAHEGALEGMTEVYRKAQQWNELVAVLVTRVDRALTPARARDLRTEAAEILETRINDIGRARDLYEVTLAEDPGHQKTVDALARIYQRSGDFAGYVKILERQGEALTGNERAETLARIGEIHEDNLADLAEAQRRFEAALELDPGCVSAMRGLDRVFNRTGRYGELLANLEKQVSMSATPRQKITLLERIAGIHDEEFLDHAKASEALEKVLALDPGHDGAITALMRHYRALDRWDDVNSLYDRALKGATEPARRVQLLLAQGSILLQQVGSPERARQAYEAVLQLEPQNAAALDSLAHVRAATGDAMAALTAVESLAEKAESPEARAEQWIRAGKILEQHGDRDGAIQRYKFALEAQPQSPAASDALRKAFLARGDAASAGELIEAEIERTEGKLAKARLYIELAVLKRDKLNDGDAARDLAQKAIAADPGNAAALLLLGDIAFERSQFLEASNHYGALSTRIDALPQPDAKRLLVRFIDSLARIGSTEMAKSTVDALLALAPDDHEALSRAGRVQLDSGDATGALATFDTLFERFDGALVGDERGHALLQRGKALRLAGRAGDAIAVLTEASELLLSAPTTLDELAKAYEATEAWEDVVRVKQRQLDTAEGEERANLLVEIGEVLGTQLKDATRAAKSFVAALEERPDDRRVLTRLMRVYSEEKDWTKLLDVVIKLAESIDDKKQKAKYVHTAAGIALRQMNDFDQALGLLGRVLDLDPENDKALRESVEAREAKGDWEDVAELVRTQLERAEKAGEKATQIELHEKLADLFNEKLGRVDSAVAELEKAHALAPEDAARAEKLASIYVTDLDQFIDKALAAQHDMLRRDPFNPTNYRALKKLYTHQKAADPAWCACQALHVMKSAEPDEDRFFSRMRSESAAEAQVALTAEDWTHVLTHELVDPILTQIFQLIEPAIVGRNAKPLAELGFHDGYKVDLATVPYPIPQTLNYAAGVLGLVPPPTFHNAQDPSGIAFLHASPPSILLGQAALATGLPTQAAAFIAARHLTYYRSGLYVRHLVPTGTGLRAWLFGAIRLIHDAFPVAAELESTVKENSQAIRPAIDGPAREQLASLVTKLLQGGSIDLKRWVAGIDLSADRAGLLVCHDLELACEMVKASDESTAAIPHRDRIKELTLFSVDPKYFGLRQKLGIAIDS